MSVGIIGTGSAAPKLVVTNNDLAKVGDTSDEWIVSRTGIRERRILTEDETLQDLVNSSAKEAMENAKVNASDIDLIVAATMAPTNFVPGLAAALRKEIRADKAVAFDVNSACSGFVYAVWIAQNIMEQSGLDTALVVGADALSKLTDWDDRSTFVLFGDGAGAVVLKRQDKGGILATNIKTHYDENDSLIVNGLKAVTPFGGKAYEKCVIKMDGKQVFKFATSAMVDNVVALCEKAGKELQEIDYIVPHQANGRIIDHAAVKLKIPLEKFFKNIDKYGNTSAGSVPLALHEFMQVKKPQAGDLVAMVAFGGGLSSGGVLFEI